MIIKRLEQINISQFSGPFDLLLTLVKEKKIDILEINIIEIANQYLEHINSQTNLNIEIASEYLVLAAQLIQFKAKILLNNGQLNLDDKKDIKELLNRLNIYNHIKTLSNFYHQRQDYYLDSWSKLPTSLSFLSKNLDTEINDEDIDILDLGVDDFKNIYKQALVRFYFNQENNLVEDDYYEEEYSTIDNHNISPNDIQTLIINTMSQNMLKEWQFKELIKLSELSFKNLVATFVVILDLVKYNILSIRQTENIFNVTFYKDILTNKALLQERLSGINYE